MTPLSGGARGGCAPVRGDRAPAPLLLAWVAVPLAARTATAELLGDLGPAAPEARTALEARLPEEADPAVRSALVRALLRTAGD